MARARLAQLADADVRAARRYAYVRIVHACGGTHAHAREVLCEAILKGTYTLPDGTTITVPPPAEIDLPAVPADATPVHLATLRAALPTPQGIGLWRKLPAERTTLTGLRDAPRAGRPPVPLSERAMEIMKRLLALPAGVIDADVVAAIRNDAKQHGEALPSENRILRALSRVPGAYRKAGQHGKRAVVADVLPKGALPYTRPYECFLLDETTLPVYVRVWLPSERQYISIKLPVCLVIDAATEIIVGHGIANPVLRGVREKMNGDEIFAAFCSSVFPELATDATRDYAGYLPKVLRLDNIASHGTVENRADFVGIDISHSRTYHPWSNGLIEKVNQIIKPMCCDILGYDERWAVAEYERDDPFKKRRALAATMNRLPPHVHVTIEQLLDSDLFGEKFDLVVNRYNRELVHSEWKVTRDDRYHELIRREQLRSARDGIPMLTPGRTAVRSGGVTYRGKRFQPVTPFGHHYEIGDPAEFRADPLLRGLFVDEGGVWTFLRPIKEWAADQKAADVSHAQHAIAQHASNAVRDARHAYQVETLGSALAAELANATAADAVEHGTGAKKKKQHTASPKRSRKTGPKPDAGTTTANVPTAPPDVPRTDGRNPAPGSWVPRVAPGGTPPRRRGIVSRGISHLVLHQGGGQSALPPEAAPERPARLA